MKCKRCGTCCMENPPALHEQDLEFIANKKISFSHLITYRRGELLYDNINNKVFILEQEIVKLRTKEGLTACIFYNEQEKGCSIYGFRPIECRKLKCWDPQELIDFYETDRINRFSLIAKNSAMAEIILLHEQKTDIDIFRDTFFKFKDTKKMELKHKLEEMISYDLSVRDYLRNKIGATQEIDFLFGRPLNKILYEFKKLGSGPIK